MSSCMEITAIDETFYGHAMKEMSSFILIERLASFPLNFFKRTEIFQKTFQLSSSPSSVLEGIATVPDG